MSVMMLGAKSSRDSRAPIQNGFWGIKYLIVIGFTVSAFFIPNGSFGTVWMWIGLLGGVAFILVQLVLIVDFAHNWAETWVGEYPTDAIDFSTITLDSFQTITMKMNLAVGIAPC